ncbi:MAG: glycosyltransferase family 1 protein [Patescibacteria group bacterium]|nr:glycosyltransferase family 1 protein [Patescibacteria group bacterium]MDD5490383.1 glycosyltransferase family 1 protein [Patescibacteria group bacterium]
MLIGIDASRANKKEKTGTEWYSYYLIQEFKKLNSEGDQFILYSKEALCDGLENLPPNWRSKILTSSLRRFWTQWRLSWEMIKDKPDILFVPAHTIPLIHPKRTVTTLHDIGFERFPEIYNFQELAYHRFSARFAIKHAKRVITVSNFSKQEMIDIYGADPEKISVVYNGYNSDLYKKLPKEEASSILEKYNISQPYFLFLGRLEEKKNVAGLIRAFNLLMRDERFGDYKLVLVGRSGYFGYQKIKDEIFHSPVKDKILELGWVEEQDLPAFYNGATAFIFPSFYEGFGIPITEAMACGTPVVCSNRAALPEIAGGAGILIEPENFEEFGRKMGEVVNDENLRRTLIEKGLERAKLFSWKKCAEETMKILKQ